MFKQLVYTFLLIGGLIARSILSLQLGPLHKSVVVCTTFCNCAIIERSSRLGCGCQVMIACRIGRKKVGDGRR